MKTPSRFIKNSKTKYDCLKQRIQDRRQELDDMIESIAEDPQAKLKDYLEERSERQLAIADFESVYYYKGNNVVKLLGKFVLRLESKFCTFPDEKQELKAIIKTNQALRDAQDSARESN